jgi:hypothetical protein
MQPTQSYTSKGVWLFYFWFLLCVVLYLFKIPLNVFTDFQNLAAPFQNSSWNWNQIFQILGSHLLVVFISLAYLILFLASGEAILKVIFVSRFTTIERWVWSLALGLAFWGLLAESLALTDIFYPNLLRIFSAASLLLFLVKDRFRALRRCWPFEKISGFSWPWKMVLGVFLILTLSNLLAPEMSWDAITYQLVLPRYYLLHHSFYSVPGIVPAQYPSLGEMFFSWGLAWGDDSVARFFCFWAHLATSLTLMTLGARLGSERTGWYAAAFYVFFPYLNIYSTRGYVDLFAGFYVVLGLGLLILLDSESFNQESDAAKKGLFLLVCLALGVVWGIKYNAIMYWLVALVVLLWKLSEKKEGFFFLASLFLFPAFFFGPWVLKSWEYIHNPVYPYLANWFHSFNWNEFDQRVSIIKFPIEGLRGIVRLPQVLWGIFFERYSGAPNEEVGLAILVFSPLLLMKRTRKISTVVLWLAIGIPFSFWLVTSHQLRLMIPVIAFSSLAASLGFEQALRTWNRQAKWIALTPLILVWLAAFYLFQGLLEQPNPFAHFLGFQTRDQFLNQIMRPVGYVDLNHYLNQTLPVNTKVLILGQENGYYLQRESVFDFDYTHPLLKEWVDKSSNPEELYRWFLKNDFDYLLYNSNAMMGSVVRTEELGAERYFWTPAQLKNYELFFLKYTRKVPLPIGNGYSLYRILPRGKEFSTFPEFLPGTEKYYLDDMVQLIGYKKASDIVGRSVPPEIYAKAYNAIAMNYSEFGYPCFQSALADLAKDHPDAHEVLEKGRAGFARNGDEASWLALQADVLLIKGRSRAAVPLLEKAQLLSPEKDDVARNLSVAYYNEHHIDKAVQEAETAVALAPYSDDYRKLLSQLKSLQLRH